MSDDTTIYAMSPFGGKRVHRMARWKSMPGGGNYIEGKTLCGKQVDLWRRASHNQITANGVCALCTSAAIRLNRESR